MADLTPEEQRFFETGELQPGMVPEPPAPAINPVDLAGLGNQPAPEPVAPPIQLVHPEPPLQQSTSNAEVAELLRRSLAEAQQRIAELEHHVRTPQQQPSQEEPAPDPDVDPLGAMMHKLNTLNKQILDLQNQQQTVTQQQTAAQTFEAFKTQVSALRDQFMQQHPDFEAAYNHVRSARVADLANFGMTQKQINEVLFREEVALAESAIRQAKNPAQVIYEMAQRHGYRPTAVPNTQTPPAAKIHQIQQAQAAARTLASQPTHDPDLSVETLKNASDSDLNRIVMDPKAWSKLTGTDQYPI